jgi:4-hydroxy-tetrahydrodipicolinate synthase|tara:strand:- start:1803 stop:2120 length:318 start_codon:yes stop_codon:yes gene_type:complete
MAHGPEKALTGIAGITGILVTPHDDAGEYPAANRLIENKRGFEDIRAEAQNRTNVTGVKAALVAIGQECGPTRPPSAWPLADRQQRTLDAVIADNRLTDLKEATT